VQKQDKSLKSAKRNLRAVRLCAQAQVLFDDSERTEGWILGLFQVCKQAIVLDLEYQEWSDSTVGPWSCRKLSTSFNMDTLPPMASRNYPCHFYYDIWVAYVWNNHRSFRIHVHEVLLHCITLLRSHPSSVALPIDLEATCVQSRATISDLVHDICASIPFCLGDINSAGVPAKTERRIPLRGYLLLWPLYVATVSSDTGSAVDVWIREKLGYISNVMGIRRAQTFADQARKEFWDLG